jgi:hypothetical protein
MPENPVLFKSEYGHWHRDYSKILSKRATDMSLRLVCTTLPHLSFGGSKILAKSLFTVRFAAAYAWLRPGLQGESGAEALVPASPFIPFEPGQR